MRRKLISRLLVVCVAVLAAVVPSVVWPLPAFAEACGTNQNLQVGEGGFGVGAYQVEGASATLTNPNVPALCTTNTDGRYNFSTSWSMLFEAGGVEINGYVQSGLMFRYGYSCTKLWAEQNETGSRTNFNDYYVGGCASTGSSYHFWQQSVYVSSGYVLRSNVNTTVIHQTAWFPSVEWTQPYYPEFSSETYYAQSHVIGTSSSPLTISSMQVQRYSDDGWEGVCGNVTMTAYNHNSTRWGDSVPACDSFKSWTN